MCADIQYTKLNLTQFCTQQVLKIQRNENPVGFLNDHCYMKNLQSCLMNIINDVNLRDIQIEFLTRKQSNCKL